MSNPFKPAEDIIIHQPIGLSDLGSLFNADAPFRACRLCGSVYQSPLDHQQYQLYCDNDGFPAMGLEAGLYTWIDWRSYQLLELKARNRRDRWEQLHNRRCHNTRADRLAIEHLHSQGIAFTPEAAHKLTSYGIFPTGNKDAAIVHAMATAPRAPDKDPDGL